VANKYSIMLELSSDDIWDREIIASLSRVPAEYATPLLKSEILKWSRGVNELTSINSVGLELEKTLLREVKDMGGEEAAGANNPILIEKPNVQQKKKQKVSKKRLLFGKEDEIVEEKVLDNNNGLSVSQILKNKIKGNYLE